MLRWGWRTGRSTWARVWRQMPGCSSVFAFTELSWNRNPLRQRTGAPAEWGGKVTFGHELRVHGKPLVSREGMG